MLYDKRWDAKIEQANPLSLPAFIAWLEGQPASKVYEWQNCHGGCLVGQYGKAVGIDRLDARMDGIRQLFGTGANYAAICEMLPNTFGAALDRARKLTAQG